MCQQGAWYLPQSPILVRSRRGGLTCRGCRTPVPIVLSALSVAPAHLTHTALPKDGVTKYSNRY